jgi:prophage antirepressor-like protein
MKVVNEDIKAGSNAAQLAEFKFREHKVRIVLRDGVVWFVLADICQVFAIKNPARQTEVLG